MKRIKVSKKQSIAELIEEVIGDPERDLVLVVPKGSGIGASVSNFHLLYREAKAANKNVSIESVDESVVALAQSSGIEANHPLLGPRPTSALSDIVARSAVSKKQTSPEESAPRSRGAAEDSSELVFEEDSGGAPLPPQNPSRFRLAMSPRMISWLVASIGIVWGAFFITNSFFSRASVDITFRKLPWSYEGVFTVDASVSKPNPEKNILPGELFTLQKNLTQLFPASGKSNVSAKASGKMFIYNAYSSKPQALVATTRFETPDGKVFRISNQVVVPAAEIKNGKITPSKIEANIVADKPGPDYNVGPIAKLTIPGFKGTPRYDGFYGELIEPTRGGFVGERAVATADDMVKAKNKTGEILKTSLQNSFLSAYPSDFTIPDGASEVNIGKLSASEQADGSENFGVFGEASMKAIGFKEESLKSLLLVLTQKDNPKLVFKELRLTYQGVAPDFAKKKMTIRVSASSELWPPFQNKDFASAILGKPVSDVRSMIFLLDGLASAKISLWPVWLGAIPGDRNKVKVSVY
ncbi:MAG: hypothetical protein HY434_00325 [Candidatus Liptonbacteria bacterium]|nr:hypothetical protein [Candidatus Liptonbacteria bacterium]